MAGYGYLDEALAQKIDKSTQEWMTIGRVVDTNDPQQMGRVRAVCPAYGDSPDLPVRNIPWAMYVSPFGGIVNSGTRGAEQSSAKGPVAYGMWNIPKVGAYVLVGCIDGDKNHRFYAGCIQPQYMTHTMPHGRYTWHDTTNGTPDGPLDTLEQPIEPLYSSFKEQFTKKGDGYAAGTPSDPHRNMEWRTRGVDDQVSAITPEHVHHPKDGPGSKVADHEWDNFEYTTVTEENGDKKVVRGPGYGVDQQDPYDRYASTGTNYDSLVYSWTTPGFHSVSMDDRSENSRIRIRTTSGHQIIMDDTNERIYISAAGGESWVEIDKAGNIDIYASRDISTHAGGDISFTADKTFRVHAKEGIHMVSDDEVRIHAKKDMHARTDTSLHVNVGNDANVRIGSILKISTGSDTHINTGGAGYWTTGGEMHHKSGSTMYFTGGTDIHLNGPTAQSAATAGDTYYAFIAARVPEHEPWARIYSDPAKADQNGTANSFQAKPLNYTDASIGKVDRNGTTLNRNPLWHR